MNIIPMYCVQVVGQGPQCRWSNRVGSFIYTTVIGYDEDPWEREHLGTTHRPVYAKWHETEREAIRFMNDIKKNQDYQDMEFMVREFRLEGSKGIITMPTQPEATDQMIDLNL